MKGFGDPESIVTPRTDPVWLDTPSPHTLPNNSPLGSHYPAWHTQTQIYTETTQAECKVCVAKKDYIPIAHSFQL